MCAVAAGAARAAAAGNSCFQMDVSAVPDGPAFGNCAVGILSAAGVAFNRRVCLGKGSDSFKFMVAVVANIFVNRHNYQRSVVSSREPGCGFSSDDGIDQRPYSSL